MGKIVSAPAGRPLKGMEVVGLVILALAMVGLFVNPGFIGGIFDRMVTRVKEVVVNAYLTGTLACAIICSVLMGRVLERLGMTDAMLRVFMPVASWLGINPTVVVPGVYNILGDINAAGRIAGPVLKKAGATRDEQKIAVATMVQSQQSFSTFMLGLIAMSNARVWAFPVVILGIFAPLVVAPLLLSKTIYRDCKRVSVDELPSFTPKTGALQTLAGGTREGAELVFLLIIPAAAMVFSIIGALDYIGIWKPVENALTAALSALSIDPKTGILSVLASPTLAMNTLKDTAAGLAPKLVVGSFILAASGFPLQVIFGQIPAVWSTNSNLSEREAMEAAVLGAVLRVITAVVLALVLTPLIVR
ncbi:MAG: hypothetical protein NUV93_07275 [Firmicutes bacterium]|jgi:hypothetical protein|nr:hypothetical protein [Bacillota bacterium]